MRQPVIGTPLMAHESEMRLRVASLNPRKPLHEDAHESDAEDDPDDVHRYRGRWMLIASDDSNPFAAAGHVPNSTVRFCRFPLL